MLIRVYGIEKDGTDEPVFRVVMEMQTERKRVDTAWEGGGGTDWESGRDAYTFAYVN